MPRTVEFDEEHAIQKAMEVFWEKGYNATSLRDLTDAMKINSSSLYNTIGDKQELFIRCVTRYTEIRKQDLQRRMAAGGSSLSIQVNYINDAVKVIIGEANGCLAVKTAFEVGDKDPRIKDVLKTDSKVADRFLCTLIRNAMEEGDISKEEDPALLADYFNSTWIGWYESYLLHKDAGKIRKMAQYFIKQISK